MHLKPGQFTLIEGVAAGILFGTAAIFIRFLQSLDAFSIAFWRLIIASLGLTLILLVFRKLSVLNLVFKSNMKELLVLGGLLGLHFILFISAVKDTTILNATVLVNTSPIFSMGISAFIFKSKPSRLAALGIAVAVVGVCLIAYAGASAADQYGRSTSFIPSLKGDFEAILAAVVEALYLNYGKKVRSQNALLPTMLPIYVFAASTVAALSTINSSGVAAVPAEATMLISLLGLGILPTAVAHTLYFSSLSNFKAFETATMALLEPIGATILGAVLFAEIPQYPFILGTILTLLGIVFVIKERS